MSQSNAHYMAVNVPSINLEVDLNVEPPLGPAELEHFHNFTKNRHSDTKYPSQWCDWIPSADGTRLLWNGNPQFYQFLPWLKRIVKRYSATHNVIGTVKWTSSDPLQWGTIIVSRGQMRSVLGPQANINFGKSLHEETSKSYRRKGLVPFTRIGRIWDDNLLYFNDPIPQMSSREVADLHLGISPTWR